MGLVTVAAVQAAPVFLDRDATVEKACALVYEAGRAGAQLVAFPEAFVPGFPHWIYLDRPQSNEDFFVDLVREAVDVPSPATDALGRAAREAGAYVVIGVNERSRRSAGELFNTNLVFSPDGLLLGWHRKLMPTYAEKMIWSFGDGSTLRVYETPIGRLGTLCCGENTNPLARFALIAQGEQVHVANYPARPAGDAVDLRHNIQIRSAAHAFEANCFVVAAGSLINDEMRERLGDTAEKRRLLGNGSQTFTGILGPDGKVIAGPAGDDTEEIVYGSIDLELIVRQKIHHDVAGNYNRFDVLSLALNRAPLTAIRELAQGPPTNPASHAFQEDMKLYDYAASANCYKVRLLLAQLERPYERVPIDIFGGDTLTEEYAAKNPARATPVLETEDGRFLPESNAILLYLAQGTPFLPSDPFELAQVVQWLLFEQTDVMMTMGGLRYRLLTGRFAPDSPDAVRRREGAEAALRLLDDHLQRQPFLVGGAYTIADIATYAYTHVAPEAGLDLAPYPAVRAWLGRVEEQPGYMNDLAPYPENARPGAGRSIYD